MPIPASESGGGDMQTPEVLSQNELFGHCCDKTLSTNGAEMAAETRFDFLTTAANTGGSLLRPRGSIMGAPNVGKFDLESLTSNSNVDAKEAPTSDYFNVDDFFKFFDDDNLPLSSQEIDESLQSICGDKNVGNNDLENIGMSIEERNDAADEPFRWVGDASDAVSAAKPAAMDKYAPFVIAPPVHTAIVPCSEEKKPDIVQTALEQSDAFTIEDLANANVVMVPATGAVVEELQQYMTLDPSFLAHIGKIENNNNNNNLALPIGESSLPVTVEQAAEPEESCWMLEEVVADTTATPSTSRGAKKRKAPSSIEEFDDYDNDDDFKNVDYQEKRRRNNIAVRKSRAQAKEKHKKTEEENKLLKEDNEKKSREIEILQREIKIYKELFERTGFSLPRKGM